LLLERAKETGVRNLDTHAALLVLPRPLEALAVKDESGIRVATIDEGYELKGEQAAMALEPIGLEHLAIGFYNAIQDDPRRLSDFLIDRLAHTRKAFRARLFEVTSNAKTLLLNREQEQVQEVVRAASSNLRSWAHNNAQVPALKAHVQDSLMSEIATAYASTIRASVRREGEWHNLSYSHHLGFGARRLAALSLGQIVEGFSEVCRMLVGNPNYAEAADLIRQADQVLRTSYDELLRKLQLMGQTTFRDELKVDSVFWAGCESEWGRGRVLGRGYRDRVASRNDEWFVAPARLELETEIRAMLEREWGHSLKRVTALFDSGD
jgi:hypothetical protein